MQNPSQVGNIERIILELEVVSTRNREFNVPALDPAVANGNRVRRRIDAHNPCRMRAIVQINRDTGIAAPDIDDGLPREIEGSQNFSRLTIDCDPGGDWLICRVEIPAMLSRIGLKWHLLSGS